MSRRIGDGCSSHSCLVKKPEGMGTNGPCTCNERELRWALINVMQPLQTENAVQRSELKEANILISELKEDKVELQADNERLQEGLNNIDRLTAEALRFNGAARIDVVIQISKIAKAALEVKDGRE